MLGRSRAEIDDGQKGVGQRGRLDFLTCHGGWRAYRRFPTEGNLGTWMEAFSFACRLMLMGGWMGD